MNAPQLPRVLCVDDEQRVLDSLRVILRKDFEVHCAISGEEALRTMDEIGNFAVICSDMRMPNMNGATLLSRVKEEYPETTRILLTGEPGRDAAVNAVNEGQIFRFLTKPCPPDKLKVAIDAGIVQHSLVTAERVLLQETLVGCIKALIDVLAITNPVAFGRATRIKRLAMGLAKDMNFRNFWQLEAAALLSQLGYLSLPVELVEKLYYGEMLTPDEKVLASGVPEVAKKLLGHIPRLEPVLQILSALNPASTAKLPPGTIDMGAKILSITMHYDNLVTQGMSSSAALEAMQTEPKKFVDILLEKLKVRVGGATGGDVIREIQLRSIQPGMILVDELRSDFGVLILPRGIEISDSFIARMRYFGSKLLAINVRVMIRDTSQSEEKKRQDSIAAAS